MQKRSQHTYFWVEEHIHQQKENISLIHYFNLFTASFDRFSALTLSDVLIVTDELFGTLCN